MSGVYDSPRYYDIAFSYRDFAREVSVFNACIEKFSRTPVRRVLEICCGQAPHLEELHKQGFHYVGVDRSESMLERAREKAEEIGVRVELLQQDLTDFSLSDPADFAFVALASLYVTNNEELLAHFIAMARALRPGALYLMEWCVDFDPMVDVVDSWEVEREGIRVQASYWSASVNRVEQLYEDTLHLEIDEGGRHFVLEDKSLRRRIFPQEFLAFVRDHTDFEFLGWWNDWDLNQPITGEHGVDRPIILLRRKS
jgi:SAM-dependent methyltransferase